MTLWDSHHMPPHKVLDLHEKGIGKKIVRARGGELSLRQHCFPNTMRKQHTQMHSTCNKMHKACTRSSQTKIPASGSRWVLMGIKSIQQAEELLADGFWERKSQLSLIVVQLHADHREGPTAKSSSKQNKTQVGSTVRVESKTGSSGGEYAYKKTI